MDYTMYCSFGDEGCLDSEYEVEQLDNFFVEEEPKEETVSISKESCENAQSKSKKSKKSKMKPATKQEKHALCQVVQKEQLIWDLNHPLHSNIHAVAAAWGRIVKEMPSRTPSECKDIWKSLKDSWRYYNKKKMGKSGDSGDEDAIETDMENKWEFSGSMAFMSPVASKYPRRTTIMGFDITQSSTQSSTQSLSNDSGLSDAVSQNSTTTTSESNYSYASHKKSRKDALTDSVINMSNTLNDFLIKRNNAPQEQPPSQASSLKFEYIWKNLDKLFDKMSEEDVNWLNFTYVKLAYEKLQKN